MIATVFRKKYLADRTLGELFVNGSHFCYTLEDPVRLPGVKIKDQTAIPAGVYRVDVNNSPRFGRQMPQLMNVPNFDGVRVHGGNGPENTSGCLLVAYQLAAGDKIYKTAEADFTKICQNIIDTGDRVYIAIIDDVNAVTGSL